MNSKGTENNICKTCAKYKKEGESCGMCLNSRSNVFKRKVSATYACGDYTPKKITFGDLQAIALPKGSTI